MVPLFLVEDYSTPAARLSPVFRVNDVQVVMTTQYVAAVERRRVDPSVANLAAKQEVVMHVLDMLLTGY